MYNFPAYILFEIPEPIQSYVKELRSSYCPRISKLPVDICISGSSGIGPISVHESQDKVNSTVNRLFAEFKPFEVKFGGIRAFPNTNIFHFYPEDRSIFDRFHSALKGSDIEFTENIWPYNPHCTVSVEPLDAETIKTLDKPSESFIIDTVCVYDFDSENAICNLQHKFRLPSH